MYVPAIIINIAKWSNLRQKEISFSSFFKAWYKKLAKNKNIIETPYIDEITNLNIDSFDTYNKSTAPNMAVIKPTKCE